MLGISSDGDSRLLGAMKLKSNMKINPLNENELKIIGCNENIFIQDPTHIGTKLRNRMLKASILLPFGKKIITVSHLKCLIETVPKDVHGLVTSDVLPEDRQNYRSLEKVMEDRVLDSLEKHIIDSEATIEYLKLCKSVTSSLLNRQISPLERLYNMWRSVFVLRIWRNFIEKSDLYKVSNNFISLNAYDCIEVNALCLTRLIMNLRNKRQPELFMPHLFDSQPCERTFRQLRSLGTINWTRINFSLLELLHIIERIELQNDIIYDKLHDIVHFPRFEVLPNHQEFELPSDDAIFDTIKNSLKSAIELTSKFGMDCDQNNVVVCRSKVRIPERPMDLEITGDNGDTSEEESEDNDDIGDDDEYYESNRREFNLRSYEVGEDIGPDSKYIQVFTRFIFLYLNHYFV